MGPAYSLLGYQGRVETDGNSQTVIYCNRYREGDYEENSISSSEAIESKIHQIHRPARYSSAVTGICCLSLCLWSGFAFLNGCFDLTISDGSVSVFKVND